MQTFIMDIFGGAVNYIIICGLQLVFPTLYQTFSYGCITRVDENQGERNVVRRCDFFFTMGLVTPLLWSNLLNILASDSLARGVVATSVKNVLPT